MSSVIAGLLFLALGWKLYKDCIATRYIALKNPGHPQYFGGALCAIQIFVLALSVDLALQKCGFMRFIFDEVSNAMPALAKVDEQSVVVLLFRMLVWAVPITWLLAFLLNHPFHRSPSLLFASARKTRIIDELEETIYYCLESKLSTCLTLKSGKVYVGIAKRTSPDPDRDRVWLTMRPLASGHRDDKGRLILETFYADVHAEYFPRRGLKATADDFQVVVPLSEISVAQSFDLYTYARLRKRGASSDEQKSRPKAANETRSMGGRYEVSRINNAIVSPRDRFHLRVFAYYVCLINLAFVLLPISLLLASAAAFVAVIACFEAIKPITLRVKDFITSLAAVDAPTATTLGQDMLTSKPPVALRREGNTQRRSVALKGRARC